MGDFSYILHDCKIEIQVTFVNTILFQFSYLYKTALHFANS